MAEKAKKSTVGSKPAEHVDVTAGAGTRRRNPHLEGLLMVIDLVLAYLFFVSALDTGSLLQYAVALLALGLGIRSGVTVFKAIRRHREGNNG